MKVDVKNLERGQIELTIELSVEEYKPFLEKAAERISQTTKIEGFRPGKASLGLVTQRVGAQKVWEEALEPAVQKTFVKALDEEKLVTVGSPYIDIVKLAPGNPVVYKAKISLLPNLELADYTKIKVKPQVVQVKDEQVDKVLADLQRRRAKETLADRQAKQGDKLEIDFEAFMDKIPIDNASQKNFPLVLGEGTFIPGFEENLVGAKKDEIKEFQVKFPPDYHQKNLAGRPADFKVTVRGVYNLEMPKLDDEFAKGLGQFGSLVDLKKQVLDNLKQEAQAKADQKLEEEMMEGLIEKTKFDDIPDLLVDTETKKMVQELEQSLAAQGVKIEDYLIHIKKSKPDLLMDFVPQALKRVKSALISRAVAQKIDVSVSDDELDKELKKTLDAYAGNAEAEKQLNSPEYKAYVKNILSARKVIDHLKDVMVEK